MAIIPAVDAPNGIRKHSISKNLQRFINDWPEISISGSSIETRLYRMIGKVPVRMLKLLIFAWMIARCAPWGLEKNQLQWKSL
jgi:hypothetical protein